MQSHLRPLQRILNSHPGTSRLVLHIPTPRPPHPPRPPPRPRRPQPEVVDLLRHRLGSPDAVWTE